MSISYDVIDLAAARRHGVAVTNIPAYGTEAVAQLTFAHILHLTNRLADHAASVVAGDWCRAPDFSYRLTPQIGLGGKTLGIVGCGRIGSAVARIGLAFGMTVIGVSRRALPPSSGIRRVELDELLRTSDFVSLHCPATPETRKLINPAALAKMKPGAFLVNSSRGGLIDEAALLARLREGTLTAALDVYWSEPLAVDHPLRSLANVVLSPHLGYCTEEVYTQFYRESIENVLAFLDGAPIRVMNPEALAHRP